SRSLPRLRNITPLSRLLLALSVILLLMLPGALAKAVQEAADAQEVEDSREPDETGEVEGAREAEDAREGEDAHESETERGAEGAGEAEDAEAAEEAPEVEVSFSGDIQPFLNQQCYACHLTGAASGELILEPGASYGDLVGVKSSEAPLFRVEPGDP